MNRLFPAVAAALLASGCAGGAGEPGHLAAEAGSQSLTPARLAQWISRVPSAQPTARDAEFVSLVWVDYTLLARAGAESAMLTDSALVAAALAPDLLLLKLRKWHDTLVSRRPRPDPALADSLFALPDFRVLQHILVRVTDPGDSRHMAAARLRVDSILARARAGEDFATLARSRSDDPSGLQGGYLPPGGRGVFAPDFERDAWTVGVGEVGGAMTAAGFHVVRRPPLAEARDRILDYAQSLATRRADSLYLDSLVGARRLEVARDAAALLRGYFDDPAGPAPGAVLAAWEGGALTLGAAATWVDMLQPAAFLDLRGASNRGLEAFVRELAGQFLMGAEADAAGVRVTAADWAALLDGYRRNLREALALLGMPDLQSLIPPGEGPGRVAAVVDAMTQDRVRWRPLPGALGAELRRRYGYRLYPQGMEAAAEEARKAADASRRTG